MGGNLCISGAGRRGTRRRHTDHAYTQHSSWKRGTHMHGEGKMGDYGGESTKQHNNVCQEPSAYVFLVNLDNLKPEGPQQYEPRAHVSGSSCWYGPFRVQPLGHLVVNKSGMYYLRTLHYRCPTFPIRFCFQLVLTLPNFNQSSLSFPCQLSNSGNYGKRKNVFLFKDAWIRSWRTEFCASLSESSSVMLHKPFI